MATHSSVLAWRIPGTAEPGGLPSMGSHRVGHGWGDSAAAAAAAASLAFRGGASGKESASQCRRYKRNRFDSGVRKIPWRREWLPTPVFLPGKSQGQRSLVGYSPWGCKESDTVEQLSTAQHHLYQPPAAIQLPSRQRWSFQREAVHLSSITIYPERRLPRSTLGGDEGVQVVDWPYDHTVQEWFSYRGLARWDCLLPLCPLLPWSCFAGSVSPSPTLRIGLSWFAVSWVLGILHRENAYGW